MQSSFSELNPLTRQLFERLRDPLSCPSEIEDLIRQGADILAALIDNCETLTPCVLAARHPNAAMLDHLLRLGAHYEADADLIWELFASASSPQHLTLLFDHGIPYPDPDPAEDSPVEQCFEIPDLEMLRCYRRNGVSVDRLGCSPIHLALLFETESLERVVTENSADLVSLDCFGRPPLLLAAHLGQAEIVQRLIALGASPKIQDAKGACATHFAAEADSVEALQFLMSNGFTGTELDHKGKQPLHWAIRQNRARAVDFLIEKTRDTLGFQTTIETVLNETDNLHLAQRFLSLGGSIHCLRDDLRCELNPSREFPLNLSGISIAEFERSRRPRFGRSNPEPAHDLFWQAMIVLRQSAYGAIRHFGVERTYDGPRINPTWSASRFGQTQTVLPDGRVIEIGGEHEDCYDTDFCIYNDVFIHEPGKAPQIFLYPEEVFPPTDFHTATLVGVWIYIIGSVGYIEDRNENTCPVYRLHTGTLAIERVDTYGEDPGRIGRHRARRLDNDHILVIGGANVAVGHESSHHRASTLDLLTGRWERFHNLPDAELPDPAVEAFRARQWEVLQCKLDELMAKYVSKDGQPDPVVDQNLRNLMDQAKSWLEKLKDGLNPN